MAGYDRLGGFPAGDGANWRASAVHGGLGGLVGSVGFCGPILLLVPGFSFRYAAAVGLFGFGLAMAGMAVSVATTSTRLDRVSGGDTDGTLSADD
ncbi:hypothetical protein [Halorientalis sp.]|uniref:hypothetical protein n=1 Tax=Halorientalis sp. TaxID=1931229 RepID=UPI0026293ED1|nr:hypothetical protein [Halorientalis sp.]